MKRLIIATALFCLFSTAAIADDEISLFNSKGSATAYIAENLTIFLWSGKPVAYLEIDSGDMSLYGFNGKHLGWFVDGVVYDHNGDAVGAVKEAFSSSVEYEPYKSYKEYEPYKSYKEYAPYMPSLSSSGWSKIPFKIFLMQGAS